ncbi:hypothetical protein L1987_17893 [Smallanthus sonchifolius]|uniref:Uncharacterized protein n=1 Tax=Smallanthus sonchifolius TaxID=185202 RepID=A0ACB9J0A2_9ASTR|nr:hypothetical protein L1987_17893 [Smallanthus sonchifolius]
MLGGSLHATNIPIRSLSQDRPNRSNGPTFARCTIADDLGGAPFGDVVSYSDGEPYHGTSIPYFYLTTLDPTARFALKDHRSSFTISEYPLGTCGKIDPENPSCSKITLTGKKQNPRRLDIEDIFLIDFYGGPKSVTVDQYFLPENDGRRE